MGGKYFETKITTNGGGPATDGKPETEGVAIGWGHGVFDSGCGAVTFMQQAVAKGTVKHLNPGHTTISMQIGTRAWSGEWSDSVANTAKDKTCTDLSLLAMAGGYLRDGTNSITSEQASQSCIQPRVRKVDPADLTPFLDMLCAETPDNCAPPLTSGHCEAANKKHIDAGHPTSCLKTLSEADCKGQTPVQHKGCVDRTDAWCCKWVPAPRSGYICSGTHGCKMVHDIYGSKDDCQSYNLACKSPSS